MSASGSSGGDGKIESKPSELEQILESASDRRAPPKIDGVIVGRLDGFDEVGQPLVRVPELPHLGPIPARTTALLESTEIGREVALMFERGDCERPIVIGVIRNPAMESGSLVFEAGREIVLRCGKASITLTRAGKILLRGAYLLSRSSGVNRIKGGSIELN